MDVTAIVAVMVPYRENNRIFRSVLSPAEGGVGFNIPPRRQQHFQMPAMSERW